MKILKLKIIFFALLIDLLLIHGNLNAQGYLHRDNKIILDGSGQEILLKGIGLGGWLLQEGYMLHTSSFANAQWEIKERILDLIGEANTEIFYESYRDNYVRKIDIDSLKSWGFNSIRLPFHYNLFATNTNPPIFLNKGFEIVDSLLSWCEENQIYLILDMHAAPGGQSDEPISDYNSTYPSLWESEQNKNLTVQVWRKIAEHYKDEPWIGGYDLLNEPKWDLQPNNQPLRDLYIRLTDTIRAVDNNHLIFIEGNWFATDFTGLTPPWDENMSYSFHKYWNGNTQSSIQYLVDLRNTTNTPLWLGETGENSNKWFTDCVELMKNNNIGWAWWPHKKIESIAGPLSAILLPAYQVLLDYWSGSAGRPSEEYAFNALMDQADKLKLEQCTFHKDVIDALIRQPFNDTTIPFAVNQIPGTIYATDYDLGNLFSSYNDTDFENTGSGSSWNNGWSYRNDGVDIEESASPESNGFDVGWTATGEWLNYTVEVLQSGNYDIHLSIAAQNSGGIITLLLDGQSLGPAFNVPVTGGWQNWQTITAENIFIPAGNHTLQVKFFFGGFNYSSASFDLVTAITDFDSSQPNEFTLEQNYPNPFNPATKVKYTIPSVSMNLSKGDTYVTLKVYDVLGSEVATLVNEQQQPGTYEVEFNVGQAIKLSSGVYYYQLRVHPVSGAGNLVETKKMIYLK